MLKLRLWPIVSVLLLLGCSTKTSTTSGGDPNSPTFQGPAETSYCASPISYSGSTVTITGTVQYTRREYWGNTTLGGLGGATTSSAHPATNNPIRHAEVRVLGPSGAVAQCAETDASGNYSFILPTSSSSYTLNVDARSNNGFLKASVLDKPATNALYSISMTFAPDSTKALSTMTAPADGTMMGAAFNILDQLHNANDYIRSKAGTCPFAGCTGFTVAPKVVAYWAPGFNPNEYFGSSSGLSFYLPGYSRLFILGGINGDVNHSDTDHFDNSVIIHEYGHFLEDTMFKSDSPGGSHNGNKVIDPRLAWSEGWGNFIQAAVRNEPHYIDTVGNDDGTTDMAFYVDLETPDGHDNVAFAGEGNFREFAVTRTLWDVVDAAADVGYGAVIDNVVSDKFVEIWASLTKTSNSFKDSTMAFRNVGLLHLIQQNLQAHESASDWTTVRGANRNSAGETDYARYVDTTTSCSSYTFPKAAGYATDTGQLSNSDLFRNNAFYHVHFGASGGHTIRLDYQDTDGTGAEKDLDLYVYNHLARLSATTDLVGYSASSPTAGKGNFEVESVTGSFPAGDYLIQVNVFTNGTTVSGQVTYTVKLDGVALCPANLVPP